MKTTKLTLTLIALAVAASSLTGCVVAPARGYVVAPAPVVVVHGYYR
jgi:hypothetical protein